MWKFLQRLSEAFHAGYVERDRTWGCIYCEIPGDSFTERGFEWHQATVHGGSRIYADSE